MRREEVFGKNNNKKNKNKKAQKKKDKKHNWNAERGDGGCDQEVLSTNSLVRLGADAFLHPSAFGTWDKIKFYFIRIFFLNQE